MKHFRILLPLLILALVLSGCVGEPMPYEYTQGDRTVTVDPANCTITNGQEIFTYIIEEGTNSTHYQIFFPDGSEYYWSADKYGGSGGWSDDFDHNRYSYASFLVDALQQSAPREKVGNPGIGLLLMGMGAVNFFAPEFVFYFSRGWMYRDAEPSDAYITWTKVCGAVAAIVGLVYSFI